MLTFIALSAALMQEPPAPAPPEIRTRMVVMGPHGPGSLDKDGDGHVSREEFAAPMNDHFARMDQDGDGRLSAEELAGGHGPGGGGDVMVFRGGSRGAPGAHRFEMRRPDHGAPGGETRFEIRTLGGEGHGHGEMDKDGDGRISEAEFTAPLRDAFARMDADRSGFIEDGERGGDGDVRVFTHRIETRDED
jgi:hypothetical protein